MTNEDQQLILTCINELAKQVARIEDTQRLHGEVETLRYGALLDHSEAQTKGIAEIERKENHLFGKIVGEFAQVQRDLKDQAEALKCISLQVQAIDNDLVAKRRDKRREKKRGKKR